MEPSRLGCRGILFDFGGTLDSDGEHWFDRFLALYHDAGLDLPQEEIKRVFYHADGLCCEDPRVRVMGLRPLMEHHVRIQFQALGLKDEKKAEGMVHSFCSKTEHILRRNAAILQALCKRYHLGIVSNFYGNLLALCEEAGLAPSLRVILDSTIVGCSKPGPEIFRMALDGLSLPAEEVAFVGDSWERDIVPAGRLGMKTVWLRGQNAGPPTVTTPPADACISSLPELEGLGL
jgi:HAD superfamily hydrolase (TIGR01509 family)